MRCPWAEMAQPLADGLRAPNSANRCSAFCQGPAGGGSIHCISLGSEQPKAYNCKHNWVKSVCFISTVP